MSLKLKLKKGLLHKKMGVPKGQKIPLADLEAKKKEAKKTGNTKLEREANFAIVAKTKFKH